jgi:hypothetical protein
VIFISQNLCRTNVYWTVSQFIWYIKNFHLNFRHHYTTFQNIFLIKAKWKSLSS